MRFSLCIPTHRLDRRLRNTLTLIQDLDYPKNLIKINLFINGSIKNISLFEPLVDRIEILPKVLGPSEAKNKALEMSETEWSILLDGDDFLLPSSLNQYKEIIEKTPDLSVGVEFSSINFFQGNKFYPPNRADHTLFFDEQLQRAHFTAACGRPIIFRSDRRIPYDLSFGFAEERKLMVDYWAKGISTHLMSTCTYIYNMNETGIKKEPDNFSKIESIVKEIEPRIKTTSSSIFLTERDLSFIDKAFLLEKTPL